MFLAYFIVVQQVAGVGLSSSACGSAQNLAVNLSSLVCVIHSLIILQFFLQVEKKKRPGKSQS